MEAETEVARPCAGWKGMQRAARWGCGAGGGRDRDVSCWLERVASRPTVRTEEAGGAWAEVDGAIGRPPAPGEAVAGDGVQGGGRPRAGEGRWHNGKAGSAWGGGCRYCGGDQASVPPPTSPLHLAEARPPLSGTVAWEKARRPTRSVEEAVDVATCEVDGSDVCGQRPLRVADAGSRKGGWRCARPRQAAHEEIGSVQVARGHGERGGDGEVEVASLGAMKLGNDNTLQFSRGAGVSFLWCLWQR
uniref:DUF834 domain-containing protein n=1 Tax=Oryza glaberrima TaxID=4538 RepID=I1PV92_ORYGL